MSNVVIDTSLAVKWEFDEVLTIEARSQYSTWDRDAIDLVVPSWFACEFANVLFQRCRRGTLNSDHATRILGRIMLQTITVDFEPHLGARAIAVALATGQKASYDAHYLALAEHLGCDLWTADERFWRATHDAFPFVKWIGNVVIKDSG